MKTKDRMMFLMACFTPYQPYKREYDVLDSLVVEGYLTFNILNDKSGDSPKYQQDREYILTDEGKVHMKELHDESQIFH